uniref:Uncharacterized protein n=1 Tax=Spongospora subterranea TaxID=70186 RepID=A0A0H5RBM2_9EUKA|eukprot:CRZ11620.1 hypothetical protein [Spongospora subterranea]
MAQPVWQSWPIYSTSAEVFLDVVGHILAPYYTARCVITPVPPQCDMSEYSDEDARDLSSPPQPDQERRARFKFASDFTANYRANCYNGQLIIDDQRQNRV